MSRRTFGFASVPLLLSCFSHAQLRATVMPSPTFIEHRGHQQIVNFDVLVTNDGARPYQLVSVQLSVFDSGDKLVLKRELNLNGHPPALDVVGTRSLPAHGTIDLFQPFPVFADSVPLHRMHFDLLFMRSGHSSPPIPLTADDVVSVDALPHDTAHIVPFCLPTRGLTLVHDGHDLFSHHRRFDLASRFANKPSSAANPNLYAYDLIPTDVEGHLYRGDPTLKQSWLSYGQPIYAPADGTVVDTANDVPENHFNGPDAVSPPNVGKIDSLGLGNHVLIRHPDGRVSWLLHMMPGSVTVHPGERVHTGQIIGRIGFSGDALFPHLHYNVTAGSEYPSQGVPSYFYSFIRHLGSAAETAAEDQSGQIDTGDLVESVGPCTTSSP